MDTPIKSPYYPAYDGYSTMSWHDKEENALKRWFENFKVDRYASFACDTEWLVVKEVPSATRRKKRFICEIGDDGRGTIREVIIDHSAPAAPLLTFAAKRHYVAPPPKTAAELRKEAEWLRMLQMGYEPVYRPKRKPLATNFLYGGAIAPMIEDVEYEIDWIQRRRNSYLTIPPMEYKTPPAPTHRRN